MLASLLPYATNDATQKLPQQVDTVRHGYQLHCNVIACPCIRQAGLGLLPMATRNLQPPPRNRER